VNQEQASSKGAGSLLGALGHGHHDIHKALASVGVSHYFSYHNKSVIKSAEMIITEIGATTYTFFIVQGKGVDECMFSQ